MSAGSSHRIWTNPKSDEVNVHAASVELHSPSQQNYEFYQAKVTVAYSGTLCLTHDLKERWTLTQEEHLPAPWYSQKVLWPPRTLCLGSPAVWQARQGAQLRCWLHPSSDKYIPLSLLNSHTDQVCPGLSARQMSWQMLLETKIIPMTVGFLSIKPF